MHRFYSEESIHSAGQTVWLNRDESKHALQVLRLKEGDAVQVFDGSGIWDARLSGQQESRVELLITASLPSPEAECRVTLWQGLPKSEKTEWIVQKGTELGAFAFWPVEMERSVAKRDASDKGEKKRERLQKIALEAAKQSARACVPRVHSSLSFQEAIREAEKEGFDLLLVAWEEEHQLSLSSAVRKALTAGGKLQKILLIIGPEGGISPQEYEQLRRIGAQAVTLGKRILRTETAGLCALSVLWTVFGEM